MQMSTLSCGEATQFKLERIISRPLARTTSLQHGMVNLYANLLPCSCKTVMLVLYIMYMYCILYVSYIICIIRYLFIPCRFLSSCLPVIQNYCPRFFLFPPAK